MQKRNVDCTMGSMTPTSPQAQRIVTRRRGDGEHGPALVEFLTTEWEGLGMTRGGFCRAAEVWDSTVIRWQNGGDPDLKNLEKLAAFLPGRNLLDLLRAAGYLDGEQLGRMEAPALRPEPLSVEATIRAAPNLPEIVKQALLAMLRAVDNVEIDSYREARTPQARRKGGR